MILLSIVHATWLNKSSRNHSCPSKSDGFQGDGAVYDCILANVNKNAIDQNIESLLHALPDRDKLFEWSITR